MAPGGYVQSLAESMAQLKTELSGATDLDRWTTDASPHQLNRRH